MLRRRIDRVVAAGASALILAFVVPLCLLVATLAQDRAMAAARQEATAVATLVSTVPDTDRLSDAIGLLGGNGPLSAALLPDGRTIGEGAADLAADPAVQATVRSGAATTVPAPGGQQVLVPVDGAQGRTVVRTFVSDAVLRQGVPAAWTAIGAVGLVLFAAALLGGRAVSRRLAGPVTEVAGVARRLQAGDLGARATPSGPTEVVDLGVTINQLAGRIEELLAAERESVADLSHRLRTPITALRLDAGGLQDSEAGERVREHVAVLQRTVDQVVADARRPVREALHGRCDAGAVVRDRAAYWRALAEDEQRPLRSRTPEAPTPVALAEADLAELVDTLVDNVFSHTPVGTAFAVDVTAPQGARGGSAAGCVVTVSDAGPGLSRADALERGVSGAGSSGLGLDIVRRIARSGGGSVRLETAPEGGLAVRVELPPVG